MKVSFNLSSAETNKFSAYCTSVIRNVDTGTKKAANAAADEMLQESLKQVPEDTGTLAASAYKDVRKRADISSYRYEAIIGYGGNGDPINPTTGERASSYMLAVHEDLSVLHVKGNAKYLERPVLEFAERRLLRLVTEYTRSAILQGGTL